MKGNMVLPGPASPETATASPASAPSSSLPPPPPPAVATAGDPASGGGPSAWQPQPAVKRPKRPMTAYNYFFREERQRILEVGLGPDDEELMAVGKAGGEHAGVGPDHGGDDCDYSKVDNQGDYAAADAALGEKTKITSVLTGPAVSISGRKNVLGSEGESGGSAPASSPTTKGPPLPKQPATITSKRQHQEANNAMTSRSDSSSWILAMSSVSSARASTSGTGWLSSSSSGNDDNGQMPASGGSSKGEEPTGSSEEEDEPLQKKIRLLNSKNVSTTTRTTMSRSDSSGSDSGDADDIGSDSGDACSSSSLISRPLKNDAAAPLLVGFSSIATTSALSSSAPSNNNGMSNGSSDSSMAGASSLSSKSSSAGVASSSSSSNEGQGSGGSDEEEPPKRKKKKVRLDGNSASIMSSNDSKSDSGDACSSLPSSRPQKNDAAVLGCMVSRTDSVAMSALSSSAPSNNGGMTTSDLSTAGASSSSSRKSHLGDTSSSRLTGGVSTSSPNTTTTEQQDTFSICSFSCSSGFGNSLSGIAGVVAAADAVADNNNKLPREASVSNAENLVVESKCSNAKKKKSPPPREKVSFLKLGRIIAHRWKFVPKHDLERYNALAAEDKKRYQREMEGYDKACVAAMRMWGDRPSFTKQATRDLSSDSGSDGCSSGRPKTSSDSGGTSSGRSIPESHSVGVGAAGSRPRPGGRKLTTKQRAEKKSMNALRKEAEEAMRSTKDRLKASAASTVANLQVGWLTASSPAALSAPALTTSQQPKPSQTLSDRGKEGAALPNVCCTGTEQQQEAKKPSAPGNSRTDPALASATAKASNISGSPPSEARGMGFSGLSQQQLALAHLKSLQMQAQQGQGICSSAPPSSQTPLSSQETSAMHGGEEAAAGGSNKNGNAAASEMDPTAAQGGSMDVASALHVGFLAGRLSLTNPQQQTQASPSAPLAHQALSQSQAAAHSQEIATKAAAFDALLLGRPQRQQQRREQNTHSAVAATAAQMAPTTGTSTAALPTSEAAIAAILGNRVLCNHASLPSVTDPSLSLLGSSFPQGPCALTQSSSDINNAILSAQVATLLQQQAQQQQAQVQVQAQEVAQAQAQARAQAQAQARVVPMPNADQVLAGMTNALSAVLQQQQQQRLPEAANNATGPTANNNSGLLHRHITHHSRPVLLPEARAAAAAAASSFSAPLSATGSAVRTGLSNGNGSTAVPTAGANSRGSVITGGGGQQQTQQSPPSSSELSISMLTDLASALSSLSDAGSSSGSDSVGGNSGGNRARQQ